MSNQPWLRGNDFFVSPWNYDPEVTKDFNFAKKIKLHDVTLRDGEQQSGITFRREDKIRIADGLAAAGVHRIEAGMPVVSKDDKAAIQEIVKRNQAPGSPEIFAFARCMVQDAVEAADCGVKGIVMEIPSSQHLIETAYKWSMEKSIDASIKATLKAKELGLYTAFFPIDCSRADVGWVLDLLERIAKDGHMDAVVLVDTFGGLGPHAIPQLVKTVKARIPDKPIEVHFHDDFGMGAANTIMALAAGADVAHTTVTAIGERAGNAAYEDIAMALLTMYNVDIGINTKEIYPLSKLVRELAGIPVQPNRGLVGDDIFNIESGIITSWYKNVKDESLVTVFPVNPDFIGHKAARVVLGKNSGIDSVWDYLTRTGQQDTTTLEEANEMLAALKAKAYDKKALLSDAEFAEIVKAVKK